MQTTMILFCNSESNRRGRTAHVAHAYCQDVKGGIHVDLKPFENSLIKEIACIVIFTKCNYEEKQLQHLNHISRSLVDYCIWLLKNHPLYLLHWVILLISFISCPWFFFLFSALPAFPLASFIRQFPIRKVRGPLPGLHWRPWKDSESESHQGYSFLVSAHFKIFLWLLCTAKRCLWSSGSVTVMHTNCHTRPVTCWALTSL